MSLFDDATPCTADPCKACDVLQRAGESYDAWCARLRLMIPFASDHCKNGHPRIPENTYQHPSGALQCRVCQRAAAARYRQNVRAS